MPSANFRLAQALAGLLSYLKNLSIAVFGGGAIHATVIPVRSVPGPVKHILAMGIPAKVFKRAVKGFSVAMPALQTRWAGTDKGFQNKSINKPVKMPAVFCKGDRETVFGGAGAENSLRRFVQNSFISYDLSIGTAYDCLTPIRSHPSLIADIVTRKVRNRFPNLRGIVKMVFSHGVALLNRVILRSEPRLLLTQDCGLLFNINH